MNHIQFFTATILSYKHLLKDKVNKKIILDSLCYLVTKGKILLYAYVIMPNHLHLIWKINSEFKQSDIQRDFMKFTAQKMKFVLLKRNDKRLIQFKVDKKDREYQIWERNALSVDLCSREVLEQKLDYIHNNPKVEKWNLLKGEESYDYSSEAFYKEETDRLNILTHYIEDI